MTRVTVLAERRQNTPEARRDLAEQLQTADAEINRTARNPNEILENLLGAGCKVAFEKAADGPEIIAEVTMPDGSVFGDTGISGGAALVFAYLAGAWLVDLPAALAATSEG